MTNTESLTASLIAALDAVDDVACNAEDDEVINLAALRAAVLAIDACLDLDLDYVAPNDRSLVALLEDAVDFLDDDTLTSDDPAADYDATSAIMRIFGA